jgi:hypothetical protein
VAPDWADLVRFPSADLVGIAAAQFPDARRARTFSRVLVGDAWLEHRDSADGPTGFLVIGPGMLQVRRVNLARQDAARRRDDDALDRARARGDDLVPSASDSGRGTVSAWSAKSQARLVQKIASLDLAPLVTGESPPAMVTLTCPGDWRAVAPSSAAFVAAFRRWQSAYRRRWGRSLACIWKREFQRRGAPHLHLWTVPPVPSSRMQEFRDWCSASWTAALFYGVNAAPGERERHLRAGTGVDFAEGLRARDPKRLGIYFLKESGIGDDGGKAYQNEAPAEWGSEVGRFWGVLGIADATETVQLDPNDAVRLWRILRRARQASSGNRTQRAMRVDRRGVVAFRRVNRRVRPPAAAGWVAVNDGAATAERLAGWLASVRPSPA